MVVQWSKPLAVSLAVVVSALGPSAGARRLPADPGDSAATEADFQELSDKANNAASVGDWETAVEAAEDALEALPEAQDAHLRRADLIMVVGAYGVDERDEEQLRRSIEVLHAYIDDLDETYGSEATKLRAREDARSYLTALKAHARLRAIPSEVPVAAPDAASRAAPDPASDRTARRSVLAYQAAGGSATVLGGVLLIAGLVYVGKWKVEADRYDRLGELNRVDPGSVSRDEAAQQDRAWMRARATALGLAVPGTVLLAVGVALVVVGTRRAGANQRIAVSAGGLAVRF